MKDMQAQLVKTNTLAHRVAHLIVQGADPRRILLMTFSRQAEAADDLPTRKGAVEHIPRLLSRRQGFLTALRLKTKAQGRHLKLSLLTKGFCKLPR